MDHLQQSSEGDIRTGQRLCWMCLQLATVLFLICIFGLQSIGIVVVLVSSIAYQLTPGLFVNGDCTEVREWQEVAFMFVFLSPSNHLRTIVSDTSACLFSGCISPASPQPRKPSSFSNHMCTPRSSRHDDGLRPRHIRDSRSRHNRHVASPFLKVRSFFHLNTTSQ
jgi:hypothetical protein